MDRVLKKIWADPVGSKVISAAIIGLFVLATSIFPMPNMSSVTSFNTILDLIGRIALATMPLIGCWLLILALKEFSRRSRSANKAKRGQPEQLICKSLVGQWTVSYEVNFGANIPQVVGSSRTAGCYVSMNPSGGLELRLNMKDDRLNTGNEEMIIRDIALRSDEQDEIVMFYHYSGKMEIWPRIARYVVADSQDVRSDKVVIEILGLVRFKRPVGNRLVTEMNGTWYDLNGNITRLLSLLEAQMTADIRNAHFEPAKLSQVPMPQKRAAARMGSVHFSRQ